MDGVSATCFQAVLEMWEKLKGAEARRVADMQPTGASPHLNKLMQSMAVRLRLSVCCCPCMPTL
jgi:hypothetical protein